MARISQVNRTVYLAPTAGRHFMTKKAAARAEARALLTRKYPTEREEHYGEAIVNRGWHWSEDERHRRTYDRLASIILRRL